MTTNTETKDLPVYLVIADAWNEGSEEPIEVHLLFTQPEEDEDDEDGEGNGLVQLALSILADEGYAEAELQEFATIDEEPEEEPHKSAWATARTGQIALIEFDGEDEEDDSEA